MARVTGGKRRVFLSALAAIAVGTLSCDSSTDPQDSYPTTYRPLPTWVLEILKAEFKANNFDYCTTLDEYGFTDHASGWCALGGPIDCSDEESLVLQAKSDVLRNRRFTGVTPGEELRIIRYSCDPPTIAHPGFHIRFGNQEYNGLTVLDTQILVHMDGAGIWLIHGHYFPHILVPEPKVSVTQAEESLIGTTLTTGWPTSYDYIVKEDSFVGEPLRVIYQHRLGDRIELRVTWSINVVHTWMVYVDTVTGEQVAVRDLVYY